MELTTDRLILPPWPKEDAESFRAINANPFVRKFLWDGRIISLETAEEILEENEKSRRVCERLGMEFLGQREMEGKPAIFYRLAYGE